MECTNVTSSLADNPQDIIDQKTLWFMGVIIRGFINLGLAFCSFGSNIINCVVFKRMGLDSTTESFFILSICDGLIGFLGIGAGLINIMRYLGPDRLRVSMYTLYLQIVVAGVVMILASMVATTVISVVRCCCVALPIQVHKFTARRQRVPILLFTVTYMMFIGYGVSSTRLVFKTNGQSNDTDLVMLLEPEYLERNKFGDYYRLITFIICFATINICLLFLITALRRSVLFRQTHGNVGRSSGGHNDQGTFAGFRLNKKEAKAVKVVVLVAAVFTVCNIPLTILSVLRLTVPGMSVFGALCRSWDLGLMAVETFSSINVTVNIIIYLSFNTRYYNTFLAVVRRK